MQVDISRSSIIRITLFINLVYPNESDWVRTLLTITNLFFIDINVLFLNWKKFYLYNFYILRFDGPWWIAMTASSKRKCEGPIICLKNMPTKKSFIIGRTFYQYHFFYHNSTASTNMVSLLSNFSLVIKYIGQIISTNNSVATKFSAAILIFLK